MTCGCRRARLGHRPEGGTWPRPGIPKKCSLRLGFLRKPQHLLLPSEASLLREAVKNTLQIRPKAPPGFACGVFIQIRTSLLTCCFKPPRLCCSSEFNVLFHDVPCQREVALSALRRETSPSGCISPAPSRRAPLLRASVLFACEKYRCE